MTVPAAPVLVQHTRFSSGDEQEVEDLLRRAYVDNRLRFASTTDAEFVLASGNADGLGADRVQSTVEYVIDLDPFDYLFFVTVDRGRIDVTQGRQQRSTLPGQSTFYPLGLRFSVRSASAMIRSVRVPLGSVEQLAEELTGLPGAQLRFDGFEPVSSGQARYWRSVLSLVNGVLTDTDSPLRSPLVLRELVRTTAVAALHTFPNTTMVVDLSGPGVVAPAALRRAVAFMEANADQPIGLSDIAGAASTSARALQHAFRRHHDTTPLAHLRGIRLERAHRELQVADPARGDTVAAIAARWGFARTDRFAVAYRAAFGVPPSTTLRT